MFPIIHIYTGNGKGKTTAAFGLAIRTLGHNKKVLICQFLKSSESGEIKFLDTIQNCTIIKNKKSLKFIWNMNEEEKKELKRITQELFLELLEKSKLMIYDLIILDEIMSALSNNLLDLIDVINFTNQNSISEIVMTGRNSPIELQNIANYISEINEIKHPFSNGFKARKGIEF